MLTIKQDQIDVFQQHMEQNFVRSLAQELRQEHSEEVAALDDEELYRRINIGIQRAARYGLEDEYSLEIFTTLMFIAAPNFDHHALFKEILNTPDLPPEQRLDYAMDIAMDEDWREIEDHRDDRVWQITQESI